MHGTKESIDEKGSRVPASFDKNGNITPETLHDYVYQKVANEVKQTPKMKSDKSSKIILVEYPEFAEPKDANEYLFSLLEDDKVRELNRIRDQNKFLFLNYQGRKLQGKDIRNANLSEAILSGIELSDGGTDTEKGRRIHKTKSG